MRPEKPKSTCIREGLAIFEKYGETFCDAQHDEFFAGLKVGEVSEEDAEILKGMGWMFEREGGGWSIFT